MKYYRTGEVAKKIGISREGLLKAIREGRITGIKQISGWHIFSEEDIKRIKKIIKKRK
jgi:predicted site-specific integrase-resolvase